VNPENENVTRAETSWITGAGMFVKKERGTKTVKTLIDHWEGLKLGTQREPSYEKGNNLRPVGGGGGGGGTKERKPPPEFTCKRTSIKGHLLQRKKRGN